MIINDSYKINEARTIDLGGGSKAYSYGGKYYIKKGDSKKEISADQYQKLLNKDTNGSDKLSNNTSDNSKNFSNNLLSALKDNSYYKLLNMKKPKNAEPDVVAKGKVSVYKFDERYPGFMMSKLKYKSTGIDNYAHLGETENYTEHFEDSNGNKVDINVKGIDKHNYEITIKNGSSNKESDNSTDTKKF